MDIDRIIFSEGEKQKARLKIHVFSTSIYQNNNFFFSKSQGLESHLEGFKEQMKNKEIDMLNNVKSVDELENEVIKQFLNYTTFNDKKGYEITDYIVDTWENNLGDKRINSLALSLGLFSIYAPLIFKDYEQNIDKIGNIILGQNYKDFKKYFKSKEKLIKRQKEAREFADALKKEFKISTDMIPLKEMIDLIDFNRYFRTKKLDDTTSKKTKDIIRYGERNGLMIGKKPELHSDKSRKIMTNILRFLSPTLYQIRMKNIEKQKHEKKQNRIQHLLSEDGIRENFYSAIEDHNYEKYYKMIAEIDQTGKQGIDKIKDVIIYMIRDKENLGKNNTSFAMNFAQKYNSILSENKEYNNFYKSLKHNFSDVNLN